MEIKTSVLLVSNNLQFLKMLQNYFIHQTDIVVCDSAENELVAIEILQKAKVDVMILDISMPQMDGFTVLGSLTKLDAKNMPKIIAAAALHTEDASCEENDFEVKYFMIKPISAEQLNKRIFETSGLSEIKKILPDKNIDNHNSLNKEITSILLKMGIPASITGYQFLREGVKMTVENRQIINQITKKLYPDIANRFHTTASKVERAIRHAIKTAWLRGKINILGCDFTNDNKKPTNGEFIALIADILIERKMY